MQVQVSCKEVFRAISDYIDDDLNGTLRARMAEHFRGCRHCSAILDGSRNVLRLVGDERCFELPAGFSERLQLALNEGRSEPNPGA